MDINELLVESVDKLPAMPQTVQELQSYTAKAGSDVRVDTVAQIISADPLVTARLLIS